MNQKRMKRKTLLLVCLMLLLLFVGAGLMAYPAVSSAYMESVRSEIRTRYAEQIAVSDGQQLEQLRQAAHSYNSRLFAGELDLLKPEENGYYEQMTVPGKTSVMGYVHIPKIGVDLPVYHGVDAQALSAGCGHLPQSSLPIGGENTHAVLSAHTGMASSRMFSDLPLLGPGDIFTLDVLGETLTYEIQNPADIRTVLPVEVRAVQIRNGMDLCTLVTCTPIGVNSHRLLVTGHRIPTERHPEESQPITSAPAETSGSLWQQQYIRSLRIGLLLIALMGAGVCIGSLLCSRRKHSRNRKEGHYVK